MTTIHRLNLTLVLAAIRKSVPGFGAVLVASALLTAACGETTGNGTSASGARSPGSSSAAGSSSGGGPQQSSGGAPNGLPDACALVTQQEASTALGAAAVQHPSPGGCSYLGPANEDLGVIIAPGDKSLVEAARAGLQSKPEYQDVPGVGDSAFQISGKGGGQFFCLKGSRITTITISLGTDAPVTADTMSTVGKAACGRL